MVAFVGFGWLVLCACAWLVLVLDSDMHVHVAGEQQVGPVLPPVVSADVYSFAPGPWIVRDNSSTILPSKRNATVLGLGSILTLLGGPHGYRLPASALGNGVARWCIAAGINALMMDTNASPDTLPNHRLQILFADDGSDPAKAIHLAEEMYNPERTSQDMITEPLNLVFGSLNNDISRSVAAVARAYNRPFVSTWTDSSVLPQSVYPTLLSYAESYDTVDSALAQFVHEHGWERVATLSTMAVDAVAEASHFAKTCSSLGIMVASREAFDESLVDPVTRTNPSLDAAVARLKQQDVRIMFLSSKSNYILGILDALDRAGLIGPKYVYLANNLASAITASDLGQRKPYVLAGLIMSQPNAFVPDDPSRVAQFSKRMAARYAEDPDSLFRCDPSVPSQIGLIISGYQSAQVAVQGLHTLYNIKQQCQLPQNQQLLQQALALPRQNNTNGGGVVIDCVAAMQNSSWNTSLGIACCRLDPVRSPYYRPPDPFGSGDYVNGDGPVLLDALRSVRLDGVLGRIGIQLADAPVANLALINLVPDPKTGTIVRTVRQLYRSTSCNAATNVCTWNITTVTRPTFGSGTTTVPDDGVIRYVAILQPNLAGRGVLMGIAIVGMIMIGIVSIWLWRYRELKAIKSSSITFVMLILMAAICALSTVITLYHDNIRTCGARIWLGHLSFTILFGSLLLKTYRLAHIFDNRVLRIKALKDRHLLLLLGIYVSIVCALLISWMVRNPPTVIFKIQQDGRAGYYKCQSSSYIEMWILLGIHAAGLGWGIYLCIKSQDVFAELNESKSIAASIYNVSLLCGLIVGIDVGVSYYNVDITFYLYSIGIILGSFITVSLLVTPKLLHIYQIYTRGKLQSHNTTTKNETRLESASGLGESKIPHKRSSKTSGAGGAHDSGSRVSDFGCGMTSTDWMKLQVYSRRCHDASTANDIGRLMMTQNQIHQLLYQIYKDYIKTNTSLQQLPQQPQHATDGHENATLDTKLTRHIGGSSMSLGTGMTNPYNIGERGFSVIGPTPHANLRDLMVNGQSATPSRKPSLPLNNITDNNNKRRASASSIRGGYATHVAGPGATPSLHGIHIESPHSTIPEMALETSPITHPHETTDNPIIELEHIHTTQ